MPLLLACCDSDFLALPRFYKRYVSATLTNETLLNLWNREMKNSLDQGRQREVFSQVVKN